MAGLRRRWMCLALACIPAWSCADMFSQLSLPDSETGRSDSLPLSLLLYGYSMIGLIDHPCRSRLTEPPNPEYALYWFGFQVENLSRPTARLLLRGDSTLALSGRVAGWTDGHNRAVPGNTACDTLQQLPATPAGAPDAVLISTYGGNDLLHGYPPATAIRNTTDLIEQTRGAWPAARIVGVGIHPTRVLSLADDACDVNVAVEARLSALTNTCSVDPYPLFQKQCGELSDPDQLLPGDLIHYNARMGEKIKSAIRDQCGVRLSVD